MDTPSGESNFIKAVLEIQKATIDKLFEISMIPLTKSLPAVLLVFIWPFNRGRIWQR